MKRFVIALLFVPACSRSSEEADRPNFLVLVADDLGYSDPGFLGSEIRTPSLDALAEQGLVLTNFHVAPACSPTRAMLLTGADSHLAGFGTTAGDFDENQRGQPAYLSYLPDRVVTVATLLRDAGYHTYMAGKWHLGAGPGQRPHERGFERSFALLPGGASHFSDRAPIVSGSSVPYVEDGEGVELPEDFFSSTYYTDKLIEYLRDGAEDDRPFFVYAAYTAPHWPLQVPDDEIDRYRSLYDEGYDVLRERRTRSLISQGVVNEKQAVSARLPWVPPWESLSPAAQRVEARTMEIYAAMVENLDHNIGRLLDFLRATGQYENTVILFLSDNGAEGNPIGSMYDNADWIPARFDNRYENMGRVNSFIYSGPGWAQASTAPFRLFKTFPTQGGIRVPAIVRFSGLQRSGTRSDTFASVMDVAPTLLELAGIEPPDTHRGREVTPIQGRSMVPFLDGASDTVHEADFVMGWELFGRRAIRKGDWKLVWLFEPYGDEEWMLFDLASDPSESNDLSEQFPEKMRELLSEWDAYMRENYVILPGYDTSYALEEFER